MLSQPKTVILSFVTVISVQLKKCTLANQKIVNYVHENGTK